jgi:DNA primase
MIDVENLFLRNGIHIADSTERHYRRGWINTPCPFCTGHTGNHLGWSINQQYFTCIRCGWKPIDRVLKALIDNNAAIKDILENYKVTRVKVRKQDRIAQASKCELLPNMGKLNTKARKYLRSRNFDTNELQALWGLVSTNNKLVTSAYKHRLIAPIYNRGRLVSWQTRDVTDTAKLRYITCSKEKEVIHHKHLVYGVDQVPTDSVVIVEGITDVWRLGFGAVATFGIKFTPYQVLDLMRELK